MRFEEMEQLVLVMQEYINHNLANEISLQKLADLIGYTPWYAAKMFKQVIEQTPYEYIRQKRMKQAAQQLINSCSRMIDLALEYQYESQEAFTRAFYQEYGVTPGKFRREYPMEEEKGSTKKHYFISQNWKFDDSLTDCSGGIENLKVFSKEKRNCFLLKGKGWRWNAIISKLDRLETGAICEFYVWVKFDYLGNAGAQCYYEIYEEEYWEDRVRIPLSPESRYMIGKADNWNLFRLPYLVKHGKKLTAYLIASEFNISLADTFEHDMSLPGIKRPEQVSIGEKRMITKEDRLLDYRKDQMRTFHGCMSYLMDCLGEDKELYDYWFFNIITGDLFTQAHSDDLQTCVLGLSDAWLGREMIKKAFEGVGYDYFYIGKEDIIYDLDKSFCQVAESLDRGIPVISRGFEGSTNYCIICGYEAKDCVLYILHDDKINPVKQTKLLQETKELIFAGSKTADRNLVHVLTRAIMDIPNCITRASKNGMSYGKQAFLDWADSLVDGRISELTDCNAWNIYISYLCMAGENCYAGSPMIRDLMLKRVDIVETPAFSLLPDLQRIFDKERKIYQALLRMGAGYEITIEQLKSPEKMRPVADKIREFADCHDELLTIFLKDSAQREGYTLLKDCVNNLKSSSVTVIPNAKLIGKRTVISSCIEKDTMTELREQMHRNGEIKQLSSIPNLIPESTIGMIDSYFPTTKESYEYWYGVLSPKDTLVPDGFGCREIPQTLLYRGTKEEELNLNVPLQFKEVHCLWNNNQGQGWNGTLYMGGNAYLCCPLYEIFEWWECFNRMAIVHSDIQELPAMKFVGIRYSDKDRLDGDFVHLWREWNDSGRFDHLHELVTEEFRKEYRDADACIGMSKYYDDNTTIFWIGMFLDTWIKVPEGFDSMEFSPSKLGVCRVFGKEGNSYPTETMCEEYLRKEGYQIACDETGASWYMTRYGGYEATQEEFTDKITFDICKFVK